MENWAVWLIVMLVLSFIEVCTFNLVTIWFVASAGISLLLSFFTQSYTLQFIVFGVSGLILMILTRPILNKFLNKEKTKTNLDRVIGMEAVVTEKISKNNVGEVKVDGKRWSATSDKVLNEGDVVTVIAIDGVKLKVKKGE